MFFQTDSVGDIFLMLLCNGFAMLLLHGMLLYCCVHLKEETLDSSRRWFSPKAWERGGRFYREKLKINIWKDWMPQHIGKGGFSKAQLANAVSDSYVEQFLKETCRGEWYHTTCLLGIVFLLLVNPLLWGLLFSALMVTIHGACIAIQRYNRCRLLSLRKKISRDSQRNHDENSSVEF